MSSFNFFELSRFLKTLEKNGGLIFGSSPLLADIVLFRLPFVLFLKVFKMRLPVFHTLIKCVSFSSPTDVGSHDPLSFGIQRPRWHSFSSLIDMVPHNPSPFETQRLRWHSFSSLINVRPPNPPPSGLSLAGTSPDIWP